MLFVDALLNAPLPNLLVVLGAFFVLLAVVSKLATNTPLGTIDADGKGRAVAVVVGPLLIVLGLLVVPAVVPADSTTPAPAPESLPAGTVATLTPSGEETTPPERVTPVDRTVTSTPVQETPIPPDPDRTLVEREPNDAAVSATVVERGVTIGGEVRSTYDPDPSMDSDYFAVWADAGEPIRVDVARAGGPGTLYVVLLDPNGLSEPNGNWLSDVVVVESGDRVRLETVAGQSGYHYVLVSGWIYLVDLDLYFNDGGTGAYTVAVDVGGRADTTAPPISREASSGQVAAARDHGGDVLAEPTVRTEL
jgi:hypothetical protein